MKEFAWNIFKYKGFPFATSRKWKVLVFVKYFKRALKNYIYQNRCTIYTTAIYDHMYSKRWSISKSSTFYLFIITRSRSNLNSSVKDKSSNIHHITATTISKSPNAIYISIILSNRIPCFLFLEVIQIEIGLHHLCEGQKTVMISRFQNSFFILISSSSTIFFTKPAISIPNAR